MSDEVRSDNLARSGRSRRNSGASSQTALKLYKPGQGYYTRMGTAIGIGVLAVCGAFFLQGQVEDWSSGSAKALYYQYGIAAGWLVLMGLLVYWVTGVNRRVNDFFIATEGEMKKVRWSTRKELVRSTKVVIVSVILLGSFLFVCNMVFMWIFKSIGVLQTIEQVKNQT